MIDAWVGLGRFAEVHPFFSIQIKWLEHKGILHVINIGKRILLTS